MAAVAAPNALHYPAQKGRKEYLLHSSTYSENREVRHVKLALTKPGLTHLQNQD